MTDSVRETFDVQDVNWNIDYKVHLGATWGRFMEGLSERRILATSCDRCGRVFVPPQPFCETCFEDTSNWQEVPSRGRLHAYTISYHEFLGSPPAPYALGAVQLEGADTMLIHFLGGADLSTPETASKTLQVGGPVEAVWAENPKGRITDIEHFVPIH